MNKLSLIGLCLLPLCANASASDFNFEVHGKAKTLYGYSKFDEKYKDKHSQNSLPSRFDFSTLAEYQFAYQYQVGVYADFQYGLDQELKDYNHGTWGQQFYGILETPYGKMIAGQSHNVAYQVSIGAPKADVLGVNQSDIVNFVANPNWQRNNRGTAYRTLNSTDINTDGTAPKLSYISPDFDGTSFGVSYIPDAYSKDGLISKNANYKTNAGYVATVYNTSELGNFDLYSSLGLAQFDNNDKEIALGSALSYRGWTLGGAVRKTFAGDDEEKINHPTKPSPLDFDSYRKAWAFEAGLGYEIGPFKSALTYFYSDAEGEPYKDEIFQFSNAYQLSKNLDLYASIAHGKFRGNSDADSNQGWAYIGGIGVKF